MIKFLEKLLNLIYIQPCYFCKSTKEDSIICTKCKSKIHHLPKTVLKTIENTQVYSCTIYDDLIKKLIKDLKYNNKKHFAKVQAQIMFDYWKELNISGEFILIPVPIHKNREKERNYNHMDIVADEFSNLCGFKTNKKFLERLKDTEKQYKLHREERIKNIKDAFGINEKEAPAKTASLLILDDITSTGITMKEIIKLLKINGYNNIIGLTLSTPDIWN